ncbi:MAG: hypothetical protein H7Z40_19120, partial [Phycisphaerae bacterium]|nr:hypothetical protein [Gemmatimonadaceae bacterium]
MYLRWKIDPDLERLPREMPLHLFANETATIAPFASPPAEPAKKSRVCISLPFARQLLNGSPGYFGGAEVRGVTFLKGLAKNPAFDMHVVVMGNGT